MSCNGCRVLRKACGEDCVLRPCLDWIRNPESQGNATLFLVKFYGRAGLANLLNAGPPHHRPVIFRSLLYETCGRIVNPVYGSIGLLSSGQWNLCRKAVDSVLRGSPISQISTATSEATPMVAPIMASDIRHVERNVMPKSKQFKPSGSLERTAEPGIWLDLVHDELGVGETSTETINGSHSNQKEKRDLSLDLTLGPTYSDLAEHKVIKKKYVDSGESSYSKSDYAPFYQPKSYEFQTY